MTPGRSFILKFFLEQEPDQVINLVGRPETAAPPPLFPMEAGLQARLHLGPEVLGAQPCLAGSDYSA